MARYLAAMLTYIKTVDEQLLERMQRDKDAIIAAFEEHIRPDKASPSARKLVWWPARLHTLQLTIVINIP